MSMISEHFDSEFFCVAHQTFQIAETVLGICLVFVADNIYLLYQFYLSLHALSCSANFFFGGGGEFGIILMETCPQTCLE